MKYNKKIKALNLFFCILLIFLIYLLIHQFGLINDKKNKVPTGNVDIIDINDDNITNDINENPNNNIDKNKLDNNFIVKDNYTIWSNKRLRIFSNQAYEYFSKIAPGVSNSYDFVIKNNNDFPVLVDISMKEVNPYSINMEYKLRSENSFLAGSSFKYVSVKKLSQKNIYLKAHSSKLYSLDWKWIDSDNDTEIGEAVNANYKLLVYVGANQK